MENYKPKILVILGPTASGKSAIAVELAEKFNGEVISADSRQVYKGLDIGTGKITKKEMRGVPHHLIDVVNLKKQFNVSDYKKLAEVQISKVLERGKLPIICGGTGLYISTLLGEVSIPEVAPNVVLRKKLEKKSIEKLYKILQKLDPRRARQIDKNNPRRLIRAIEIAKALGKVPKSRLNLDTKYNVFKIGIQIPDEKLKRRIDKRVKEWFKSGLIKEVRNLYKQGLSWKRMSEIGLEYKLVAEYLSKSLFDITELKKRMREKTWQYAQRQRTWWKRDKDIVWLPPKIKPIEKEVKKFLKSS